VFFFFQAEDGIRDFHVTGVQTCALPILQASGMGQLIAASVSGAPESGSAAGALASLAGSPPPRKSGKPILARNPFDSVTGPLDEIGRASCRERVQMSGGDGS